MIHAYLTIDNGASPNTPSYLSFLSSKGIRPILFFWGQRLEKSYTEGIQALQMGAIVGNHSYTHPAFSKISLEECLQEIEAQEALLNRLYRDAGVPREQKLFRFPYGDKGGSNAENLQYYLKKEGFHRIQDALITYPWYQAQGWHRDTDVMWTFDLMEYRLPHDASFTFEDILRHIDDSHPEKGGSLYDADQQQIILIHDHPETEAKHPGYFTELIQSLLDAGVQFDPPHFQ